MNKIICLSFVLSAQLIFLAKGAMAQDTLSSTPDAPAGNTRIQTSNSANSTKAMMPVEQGETGRRGTVYFNQPHVGRGILQAYPEVSAITAKGSGDTASADISSTALRTEFSLGISDMMSFSMGTSIGSDSAKVGDSTYKRSGFSDPQFRLTMSEERPDHILLYGGEISLSPGRAADLGSNSSTANRYSGGNQLKAFGGFQAESEYGFDFGGRGSFAYRFTRYIENDRQASGGHLVTAESFIEQRYAPGVLGALANLNYTLQTTRDDVAALTPQTFLGLGGYGDCEVTEEISIPVKIMYQTALTKTVGGADFEKLDSVYLSAGMTYLF